jgi:hypothetical protein
VEEDATKDLVGQPVFKQVVKILPREQFNLLVGRCGNDRYEKSFFRDSINKFTPLIN